MKLNIYNQQGDTKGEIEVSDSVFGVKTNSVLINEALVAQMSNERQVLADTKDRSEVRGGGKKPWRQKGTGRARAGSSRSPIWAGGGVTFGPTKDRNFSKKINKQAKRKALTWCFQIVPPAILCLFWKKLF
jgi:large subunit ribosomal protein L4